MNLRRKGPAIIMVVVGVVLLLYVFSASFALQRVAEQNARDRQDNLLALIQGSLETSKGAAEARAEMIAAMPGVAEGLTSGDRKALIALCGPPMQRQRVKFGMDQAQFASLDGHMVLRLNKPDQFGDEIRKTHAVMMACMDRGENISGAMISRAGPAIFGDAPITVDGKTAGCFEVGLPFVPMIDSLKRVHNVDAAAMFDEQMLRQIATEMDTTFPSESIVGRYAKVYSTEWPVIAACIKGHAIDGAAGTTWLTRFEGSEYCVAVAPIADIKGKPIGCLVACREYPDAQGRVNRTLAVEIFLTFLAWIMIACVVRVVFNGLLLRPIVAMGAAIGDRKAMAEFMARPDEVGDLARSIEREPRP